MSRLRLWVARNAARLALRLANQDARTAARLEGVRAHPGEPPPWAESLVAVTRVVLLTVFLVALPLILVFEIKNLTRALQVLLVLTSWAAGFTAEILVELVYRFRVLDSTLDISHDDWLAQTEFERSLVELRTHFRVIDHERRPRPDLFASFYLDRIRTLCRQITLSASSKQLRVNQTHFDVTEILMECLAGGNTDDFLAIHFLRDNAFFRDVPHARRYLRRFEEKLDSGEVKSVKRLFIVDDNSAREQLLDDFSIYFIALHASEHTKFQYRIIDYSTYQQYLGDLELNEGLAEDFGVYGNWYVYETATATALSIRGTFNADPEKVRMYRAHFARCWDEGRLYEDFAPSISLPDVRRTDALLDPFFRARHQPFILRSHLTPANMESGGNAVSTITVHSLSSTGDMPVQDDAVAGLLSLLDGLNLCSIATVSPEGVPHIHTCFYAFATEPLRLWFLTPPLTDHAQYIESRSDVAVAIYSTEQAFTSAKRGLQLFGHGRRVPDDGIAEPLSIYLNRFPVLGEALDDSGSLGDLESRFYEIVIDRARLFDEPRFGSEVWVDLKLQA